MADHGVNGGYLQALRNVRGVLTTKKVEELSRDDLCKCTNDVMVVQKRCDDLQGQTIIQHFELAPEVVALIRRVAAEILEDGVSTTTAAPSPGFPAAYQVTAQEVVGGESLSQSPSELEAPRKAARHERPIEPRAYQG